MAVQAPEQIHAEYVAAYNAGDLERLMRLYTDDATLIPSPGVKATGQAAIREALTGFLALKGKMVMTHRMHVTAGGTALVISDWTLDGTGPDGAAITFAGRTSDVAVQQAGGQWLLAIDNPFGGDGVGEA